MKQLEQGARRNNGPVATAKFVSERKTSEIVEAMVEGKMEKECLPKTFQKSHMHTHMHLHCLEMIWQLTRELGGFQYIFVNFLESVKCIYQC